MLGESCERAKRVRTAAKGLLAYPNMGERDRATKKLAPVKSAKQPNTRRFHPGMPLADSAESGDNFQVEMGQRCSWHGLLEPFHKQTLFLDDSQGPRAFARAMDGACSQG